MLLVGFAHWGIRFWGYRFFRLQMNPGYMNRIPANECQDSVYSLNKLKLFSFFLRHPLGCLNDSS